MEKKLGYSFYHLEILRLCGVGNGHDWSIFFCFIKGVFGRKVDNWKVSWLESIIVFMLKMLWLN